jgi:glycosyltransferase involved in cell wall biosynthesis
MNNVATAAVDAANVYNIPSLFFIRSLEVSGQEQYSPDQGHLANFKKADFGAKIQYPFFAKNFNEYRRGMAEADQVIANSEYVSQRLKKDFDVNSNIIYPPIKLDNYKVQYNDNGYIAAVNPRNRDKGADIFFNLVESMPDEEFICAGEFRESSLKQRAEGLSNLNYLGYCEDMRSFYKKAKVVVVPSRWNEAFGRSAAEPMVSGIPVVVSDRGGLPEVVGNTGEVVNKIESTEAWKQAIKKAINNHDPEAQKERAKIFSAELQGDKLNNIISEII